MYCVFCHFVHCLFVYCSFVVCVLSCCCHSIALWSFCHYNKFLICVNIPDQFCVSSELIVEEMVWTDVSKPWCCSACLSSLNYQPALVMNAERISVIRLSHVTLATWISLSKERLRRQIGCITCTGHFKLWFVKHEATFIHKFYGGLDEWRARSHKSAPRLYVHLRRRKRVYTWFFLIIVFF